MGSACSDSLRGRIIPSANLFIVKSARQVGKTWLLKELGRLHFGEVAYVSLDNDAIARSFFERDFDTALTIGDLSLHTGVEITPGSTLIVIDEIATLRAILARSATWVVAKILRKVIDMASTGMGNTEEPGETGGAAG